MSGLSKRTIALLLFLVGILGDTANGWALPTIRTERLSQWPSRSLLSPRLGFARKLAYSQALPTMRSERLSQWPSRSLLSPRLGFARKLAFLVEAPPLILEYHNGPVLSATPSIAVYIVWYGDFSEAQREVVRDFFSSFSVGGDDHHTVSSWWKLTSGYKDAAGAAVQGNLQLIAELSNPYTKGKSLVNSDLEAVVLDSLATFPSDPKGIYLVFTAEDVSVEGFCMNSCASHQATSPSDTPNGLPLPYAWVGNSATQCPGMCAWPYAKAEYGPNTPPLMAPNGDIGMDGIIINLGTILAGTATNPFDSGFFQGDAGAPVEAATACTAQYGNGAYPGYPGELLVDVITGASYNVDGVNDRKYLLPALWDPATLKCTPAS